jgi:osmoprotectant transport system ATP-binding protein
VIEFESVGKTFRDGTTAVVDLNLTVPSGKITVIVGPSGCGKTTTLRMVNRMLEPTTGSITWDGEPLRSKRKTTLRRQMGYVIQSGGLFPHRTVLDNIATVPSLLHWPKKKIQKRSLEVLDSVGLQRNLAHRYPAQLSGGQQQRVGVARALAADPLVLLMDEPFSAVDPVVRSELQEFFRGLQRELSKTIILITHDIDEAIKLGDQVAIMRIGGHLAQVGTPQQLLDEPTDAFVEGFIGRDRGFRSLSFQPASELPLQRVKVVRDVETAAGAGPILVVDGDARPVGWADPERPGRVFPLGSTFSPETDSLRVALDSALTSPYGLAVGVTADTQRYAGVVSADTILDRVRDVRVSIAESISIRDAEAAQEYEPLGEPEHEYESVGQAEPEYEPVGEADPEDEPVGEPELENEPAEESEHASSTAEADQQGVPAQAYEPKDVDSGSTSESVESVYNWEDEPAGAYGWEEPAQSSEPEEEPAQSDETPRPEPESSTDARPDESNADHSQAAAQASADIEGPENGDPTIAIESPESESPESDTEQRPGPTPTFKAERRADTHREDWEAMGKALYRRGSGILQ